MSLMNLVIPIIFFLGFFSDISKEKQNDNYFSYHRLAYDSIPYKLIFDGKPITIKTKKTIFLDTISVYKQRSKISNEYNIFFTRYVFSNADNLVLPFRNSLSLYDVNYNIDSLMYENYKQYSENIKSGLNTVYSFSFERKKYLSFFFQDYTSSDYMINSYVFLFDVTNKSNVKLILNKLQASSDLKCFGDFNKDKRLDYADWAMGHQFKDTLKLYELNPVLNAFELNLDKYILMGDSGNYYAFDKRKSRWFKNSYIGK